MEILGTTLFGVGRMGKIHAKNINEHPQLDLRYLVDENKECSKTVKGKINKITALFPNEATIALENSDIKACIISTPFSSHRDIVEQCLKYRKHILCEKPLTPTLKEAEELFKIAETRGLNLMVNFQRRFDPQFREIYDLVRKGEIGNVRVIKTTSRDPPAMVSLDYLKSSPGIFFDSAIHDIDIICWLANSKPTSIYAVGSATDELYAEQGDVDSCCITITFENSIIGNIEVSRNAVQGYDQRLEVFGSKGTLQSDNKRHKLVKHLNEEGERIDPMIQDCTERYAEAYKEVLSHFVKATNGTEEIIVKPNQVLMATHLAELCKKSLASGNKEFVTLSF
ncbi:DgyrCDS1942 [Dimorphilus gyrociliatus]|uniref:DgyrCDS1942 n=1 Tax=Dimorphilus gyrociliatus TaxID=2664684 RepID=A0A7I8V906_9ANNE|nr:DgyrCDS1942 [Dimorphilus gyrociliatus]